MCGLERLSAGVASVATAGSTSLPPGQRRPCRHLLGVVVPVRRTQRQDTGRD